MTSTDSTDIRTLRAEIEHLRTQLAQAQTTIRHFVTAPDVDTREPIVIEPPLHPVIESVFEALKRSPVIIFRGDREGRITSVMDPQEASDDVLGQTIGIRASMMLTGPASTLVDRTIAEVLRTGQSAQLMINLRLPSEDYWYELTVTAQRGADRLPQGMTLILSDATNRQIADRQVRLLAQTVASTMDAVVIADLQGVILFANESTQQVLGYSVEEILGNDLAMIGAPAEGTPEREAIVRASRESGWHGEVLAQRKDGKSVTIDVWLSMVRNDTGVPVAFVAVGRDISAVKKAEQRFRTLYNNTPVMLHSIDSDGRLLSVSDYWLQVSGYTRTEVIGRKSTEFLSVASARYAEDVIIPNFFQDGRCEGVGLQFVTKQGKALDVLFSAVLERDTAGTPLRALAVYEDITDRTQAERALVDSEERYRGLFEDAAISLWEIDGRRLRQRFDELAAAGHTDFARHCALFPEEITRCLQLLRVVDVNRATLELFGATNKDEFIRKRAGLFRPGSLASIGLALIAVSEGKTEFSFESPLRTIDGRPIDVVIRLSVARGHEQTLDKLLLSFVDITKRKRAEEALRESEARLQTVFESIPFDLWVCGPDGRFVIQNPVSIARWGNLVGRLPAEVNPQIAGVRDWQSSIARTFAGEMVAGEVQVETDGTPRHLYTIMTPIWEDGSVIGIMGLAIDNTERRMLQQRLLQSQKLESIGTLAGGIAHDFNNILGIIMGHASLLPEILADPTRLSRSISAIQDAGKRGAGLVRQILTFARKTDVTFIPVDLNEIVFELGRMLQETFPRTITFHLELDPDLPRIEADRTQVHQTLLNLCVNARDAMPAGGTLTIQTSKALPSETNPDHQGSYIRLTVADTGIGMDETTRRRIFEPFFTTKGPGKGTGLGLAVVYGIMESHGGFIVLDSSPLNGSRFSLYFPLTDAEQEPEQDDDAKLPQERGSGTILIVEDEEMMMDLLKGALESAGYTVLTATDGEQGLSVFESFRSDIALVITDVGLPRMSGDTLFRKIRASEPGMKVIIATGYLDPDAKSALERQGATAFIQKPYLPRDVLHKVRETLAPPETHRRVSPRGPSA